MLPTNSATGAKNSYQKKVIPLLVFAAGMFMLVTLGAVVVLLLLLGGPVRRPATRIVFRRCAAGTFGGRLAAELVGRGDVRHAHVAETEPPNQRQQSH